MAKSPVPGRVKTRLCPPCSPDDAAVIAEAALADTLAAVATCGVARRVVALDGPTGGWLPDGFEIVTQSSGTFAERLDAAWTAVGGPGIQIGMDTPQVTPALLDRSLDQLQQPGVDAVLGPALDGGWWAIGFRTWRPGAFAGVRMSCSATGEEQRRRLLQLGLRVSMLPALRDLDTFDDALALARDLPGSRTATAVASVHSSFVP